MSAPRTTFIALLLLGVLVFSAVGAFAHSPLFPAENHSIASATFVERPAKSFAIYHELEAQQAAYYEFRMSSGERIYLQTLTPAPPIDGFVPGLALLLPNTDDRQPLPSFIEVPSGYGSLVAQGDENAEGELEPFSPGPIFMTSEIDVVAPVNGTYYAVVFSGQAGGSYALALGYLEEFTLLEIFFLPLSLLTIYQWEGQDLASVLMPYAVVFVVGIIVSLYWRRKTGRPNTAAKWLAVISGLAFLGSTSNILAQLGFSFTRVPLTSSVVVSLIFAFAYLVLGLLAMRFALKSGMDASRGTRALFLVIGIVGLMMWGGIYLGPILALVIALAPPYRRKGARATPA
jgi:hypothetical protein